MNHLCGGSASEMESLRDPEGRMYSEKLRAIRPIDEYNSILEMRQVWEPPHDSFYTKHPSIIFFSRLFIPEKESWVSHREVTFFHANVGLTRWLLRVLHFRIRRTIISWRLANDIQLYQKEKKEQLKSTKNTWVFLTS